MQATDAEKFLREALKHSVKQGHARSVAHAVGIYPA